MRRAEQLHGIGVLPLRVAVGKELADVAGTRGAENRVGERVRHGVGIAMPGEPALMRNGHAAKHQRASRDEAVGVVPDPHSAHAAAGSSMKL